MTLLFLIPLAITLGAVAVSLAFKDESGEIATFSTAIGLITLILALILAPIAVKFVILLMILSKSRLISILNFLFTWGRGKTSATAKALLNELAEEETNSENPLLACKYRGAAWKFSPQQEQAETSSSAASLPELKYRGAVVR